MVATPSTMVELGTRMPAFSLPDPVSGRQVSDAEAAGKQGTLVMFICNHCPFVQHVIGQLDRLADEYLPRGIALVAINSNDVEAFPEDGPAPMKELVVERGWKFPFLFDEDQQTARAFQAACTPDFFLFDADRRLVYRGQLDDSRPGNGVPVTGKDLRAALEALLAGKPVSEAQKPSLGCNIKWKP